MGALLGRPASPGGAVVRIVHPRPASSTPVGRFTSASDLFPGSPDSPISAFDMAQQSQPEQPQPQVSSPVMPRRIDLSRFHPKRSFDEGETQSDSGRPQQQQPDSPDARVLRDQLALLHMMKTGQPGQDGDGRLGSIVQMNRLRTVSA